MNTCFFPCDFPANLRDGVRLAQKTPNPCALNIVQHTSILMDWKSPFWFHIVPGKVYRYVWKSVCGPTFCRAAQKFISELFEQKLHPKESSRMEKVVLNHGLQTKHA